LAGAALAGTFFFGSSSDESLSSLDESFLAGAFLAGTTLAAGAFFFGSSSDESESSLDSCFLAAAFLTGAALATGFLTSSSDESSESSDETGAFLAAGLPLVLLAAETFETALLLFSPTCLVFLA
jgi:hypothetical protein